jgi:glycosyltransferase involved in cell wall biosynthesis
MATERAACALAQRVICVSHSVRQVAIDAGICPPDKIVTLLGGSGNGVDAGGRFAPRADDATRRAELRAGWGIPADAPVVAFVGRLVRDKGVAELAEAWRGLRERFPVAHLVVAGPVEPQDPVPPETLDALRADSRAHLIGPVSEPRDVYLACDVVALPTYREGFPNVPLEAGAMRRPVVATRIPGCVDAVADGTTGLLVPARDADALADALARYLGDPALRAAHGEQARARVCTEFDRTRIWAALYDEYAALLAARGLRVPDRAPGAVGAASPEPSIPAAARQLAPAAETL